MVPSDGIHRFSELFNNLTDPYHVAFAFIMPDIHRLRFLVVKHVTSQEQHIWGYSRCYFLDRTIEISYRIVVVCKGLKQVRITNNSYLHNYRLILHERLIAMQAQYYYCVVGTQKLVEYHLSIH